MVKLIQRILELKKREDVVLLAHYYQRLDIQEIADFVGDSLRLSLDAMNVHAGYIVFCGVYFMAEQAAVLNPNVTVLIPDSNARCALANMLTTEHIRTARKKYPSAPVVLYVNSRAEHKALADYIVTSANAVRVIEELDSDTIIFGPDSNLADHVAEATGKNIIPIPRDGHCPVHILFSRENVEYFRDKGYQIIVHPECIRCVRKMADFIGSTKQMYDFVARAGAGKIAIGTEIDFVNRVARDFPEKEIVPLNREAICEDMKKITLDKVYLSLKKKQYVVTLPEKIRRKIREAIWRTFELLGIT